MFVSILNDVLGPVMRGPSSSHTAGSYHIGRTIRSLLADKPVSARFKFDRNGSYAKTFSQQGADRAFAMGIIGIPLTDERFLTALDIASQKGIYIEYAVSDLSRSDHPNTVEVELTSQAGCSITAVAASTGGGTFLISNFNGFPVELTGKQYHLLILCTISTLPQVASILNDHQTNIQTKKDSALTSCGFNALPDETLIASLRKLEDVEKVIVVPPIYYTRKGQPLFNSAHEMVTFANNNSLSLG